MFALLNPAALAALAALAVPLALHLWSRQRLPRIAFGTLRWLPHTAVRRGRQLRITQWLLLVLRLALLALLALALAEPVWRTAAPPQPGYVLLDPTVLRRAQHPAVYRSIDSLQAAGYALHRLAPGFPRASLEDQPAAAPPPDLWSLVAAADASLPVKAPVHVYATADGSAYRGPRPQRSVRVHLHLLPAAQASPPAPIPYADTVGLAWDAAHAAAAHVLRAAVQALYAQRRQTPVFVSDTNYRPAQLALWLHTSAPPSAWQAAAEQGAQLLVYRPRLRGDGQLPVALPATLPVSPLASGVIWADAAGQPLLQVQTTGQGRQLLWQAPLAGAPAVTLDPAFPAWLGRILLPQTPIVPAPLASAQALPALAEAPGGATPRHAHPLTLWCWGLALLVLCVERWLAGRRREGAGQPAIEPAGRPQPL